MGSRVRQASEPHHYLSEVTRGSHSLRDIPVPSAMQEIIQLTPSLRSSQALWRGGTVVARPALRGGCEEERGRCVRGREALSHSRERNPPFIPPSLRREEAAHLLRGLAHGEGSSGLVASVPPCPASSPQARPRPGSLLRGPSIAHFHWLLGPFSF